MFTVRGEPVNLDEWWNHVSVDELRPFFDRHRSCDPGGRGDWRWVELRGPDIRDYDWRRDMEIDYK